MLGPVDCVSTMLLVYACEHVCGVIVSRYLLLVDDVNAGLVKRYRVKRGKNSLIFQFHGFRFGYTVTVD